MERMVSELSAELEAALAEIGQEKNNIQRWNRSVKQVRAAIDRLEEYVEANPFRGKAEEIRYFKEVAPRFYSQFFYFMKLYQVEAWRPHASREKFREMLVQELAEIDRFYQQHAQVCHYYSRQASYWDDWLYLRRGQGDWPADEVGLFIGHGFTLGSYWASWVLANPPYRVWLEKNLAALDQARNTDETGPHRRKKLKWNKSTRDLTERLYAEWLAGSYGDCTLKEVMEFHGEAYGVDLSHFNSVIQQLGQRKKSPTKYVDQIREALVRKVEEME